MFFYITQLTSESTMSPGHSRKCIFTLKNQISSVIRNVYWFRAQETISWDQPKANYVNCSWLTSRNMFQGTVSENISFRLQILLSKVKITFAKYLKVFINPNLSWLLQKKHSIVTILSKADLEKWVSECILTNVVNYKKHH